MSKVVRFHTLGGADVLKLEEVPLPEPGAGEVRLKVSAIGLNRAEVVFRQGLYLEKPQLPSKIGYEASGVVDAVGEGVSEFKVGDKVSTIPAFPMSKYGVYGEMAIVPAQAVAHYPDNISAEEAASIWMQYLTAYGALIDYGKMEKDEVVVITAASSSVGYAAIQLANAKGAIPVAVTRTKAKRETLLKGGAKHVIVTEDEDLVARVKEVTGGKGARLFFDPVAGPNLEILAKAAAPGATIILYGALSMTQTQYPLMLALQKALTVRGYTLFEFSSDPEKVKPGKKFVYDGLKNGTLKPVIDCTFKIEDIVKAHEYMESNQQNGKIVVVV